MSDFNDFNEPHSVIHFVGGRMNERMFNEIISLLGGKYVDINNVTFVDLHGKDYHWDLGAIWRGFVEGAQDAVTESAFVVQIPFTGLGDEFLGINGGIQVAWSPWQGWYAMYGYTEAGTGPISLGAGVIFNISEPNRYTGPFINLGLAVPTPYPYCALGDSVSFTGTPWEDPTTFMLTWSASPGYTATYQRYLLLYTNYGQ